MITIAWGGEINPELLEEQMQAIPFPGAIVSWDQAGFVNVQNVEDTPENVATITAVIEAHDPNQETAGQIKRAREATVKASACDEMETGAGAIATITLAEATAFIDDQFDIDAIADLDDAKAALATVVALFKKVAKAIIALRNENWPGLQEHE